MNKKECAKEWKKKRIEKGLCVDCSNKLNGHKRRCNDCITRYKQRYSVEYHRQAQIKFRHKLKKDIYEHYGNKCVCCGETEIKFLTIDHIKPNGNKHRKGFYKWIRKNNYPEDLQILCWNCNCAKGIYGKCPHKM